MDYEFEVRMLSNRLNIFISYYVHPLFDVELNIWFESKHMANML